MRRDVSTPVAVVLAVVVMVIVIAFGWYLINREPAPVPIKPGEAPPNAATAADGRASTKANLELKDLQGRGMSLGAQGAGLNRNE